MSPYVSMWIRLVLFVRNLELNSDCAFHIEDVINLIHTNKKRREASSQS